MDSQRKIKRAGPTGATSISAEKGIETRVATAGTYRPGVKTKEGSFRPQRKDETIQEYIKAKKAWRKAKGQKKALSEME